MVLYFLCSYGFHDDSRQVSRRGGTVFCELAGGRVKLSGRGKLYLTGEILPDPETT